MNARQEMLFGQVEHPSKPPPRAIERLELLITVKAAPNPSARHGETVCVAGLTTDMAQPRWVRLYPINYRYLEHDKRFNKYDIVQVDAVPAENDQRVESWRPRMDTMVPVDHLRPWRPRQPYLEPVVEESMCSIFQTAKADPRAPSLALVRPRRVLDFKVTPHPGWTQDEQGKIDAYVNQLDLFDPAPKAPLEAPRFRGSYRWRCWEPGCDGHTQTILDWEFVALQRRLQHLDDAAAATELRLKFYDQLCGPQRDVAFFVGNQAKRHHTFSILGVYYPPR